MQNFSQDEFYKRKYLKYKNKYLIQKGGVILFNE